MYDLFLQRYYLGVCTEFDILNAGLDEMLKPLLYGGQFSYQSVNLFKHGIKSSVFNWYNL